MPEFSSASAFLVARLENHCAGRELTYMTHAFATGDMEEFDASPIAPGSATHWSCAAKRWLQGNVGCVVYGIPGPSSTATEEPAAVAAELCCVWGFPYSGEDRVGVHLGAPGAFSNLTPVTLATKFGDPEQQTPGFATVSLGGITAAVSFGRHPAIFSVTASGSSSVVSAALAPPRAQLMPKLSSFVLCELSNQLPNASLRLRAMPFVGGQCHSAAPPFIAAGSVVTWAATTSSNLAAKARGNIGAAVYETVSFTDEGVVISPMELVVMWHVPLMGGEPQVGCRVGVAGSFSSMEDVAMLAMIGDVNYHSSSPQQRTVLGHVVSSCYGRDLSRFSIGSEPASAGAAAASVPNAGGATAPADAATAPAASAGEEAMGKGSHAELSRPKPAFVVTVA
jgi:hypothetical protein